MKFSILIITFTILLASCSNEESIPFLEDKKIYSVQCGGTNLGKVSTDNVFLNRKNGFIKIKSAVGTIVTNDKCTFYPF